MALPESKTIMNKKRITLDDGSTHTGPLVVDAKGVGVDVKTVEKTSFIGRKGWINRHYIVFWSQTRSWEITQEAPRQMAGSTMNRNSSTLRIRATSGVFEFSLPWASATAHTMLRPFAPAALNK